MECRLSAVVPLIRELLKPWFTGRNDCHLGHDKNTIDDNQQEKHQDRRHGLKIAAVVGAVYEPENDSQLLLIARSAPRFLQQCNFLLNGTGDQFLSVSFFENDTPKV